MKCFFAVIVIIDKNNKNETLYYFELFSLDDDSFFQSSIFKVGERYFKSDLGKIPLGICFTTLFDIQEISKERYIERRPKI